MTDSINLLDGQYLYMCDYNQVINACIKDLFLEHGTNRKLTIKDFFINEELIKERISTLSQLIFEASANCNLRCRYCVYNGNYFNQRSLSPDDMSFETARKGIDYVFSFIRDRKNKDFAISFYGGEPLLNFKTIKETVRYAKQRFNGWELRFNMTTNLTLLTGAVLDFLVENDFSLLVSLDGGQENHDAKRVFPNGNGSHHMVLKNLEKIKVKYKEFFEKKIGFSSVYSYDLPLKNLYEFFTTHGLVRKKRVRFSMVNPYHTTYYDRYPKNRAAYRRDFKQVFLGVLEKIREGEELSGYETHLYDNLKDTGDILKTRAFNLLAGACLFDSRLYLDAQGVFHMCEKMNNAFAFGDVDKGFDIAKMVRIAREFVAVIKDHCLDCNIKFLCTRCYVNFCGDGEFKLDPDFCQSQEEYIVRNLEKYIQCKEEGLL